MTAQGGRKAVSLDGIKLSRELVWLNLQGLIVDTDSHLDFLRQLSRLEINLPFITTRCSGGRMHLCCCADAEDEKRLREVLRSEKGFGGGFELVAPVGLISMFPHRCKLQLLWALTGALKAASLPLYGFASSISSLTFVTDYAELDAAVAAVKQYVILPRGFVPSRPELRIRQCSSPPARAAEPCRIVGGNPSVR